MGEDMTSVSITTETRENLDHAQRWLKCAPPPGERGTNTFDVFISYRSSDRSWAMALYDALRMAKWEPFLDQYELVPGNTLQTSLEESLQASSSGVILWSSRTKDSEWCKRERTLMTQLKDERRTSSSPFNYVFAKLDDEPLPGFAKADLYMDFVDSPEGPRGANLLRLICGMRGIPLPPEAVELAQQVDEDIRQLLRTIKGAVEAANPTRLKQFATSNDPGIAESPVPLQEAAQGLISMDLCEDAMTLLQTARLHFPQSVRVKQLEGLALRRLRRYQDAIDVLSELKADGHQDPETLGILAASWDGLYQESGKALHLRRSRDLYRTAFQIHPKDYYTGINAAAKSAFLGEPEETKRLVDLVIPLVKGASDGSDFWAGCTLAEAYLLQQSITLAAAQYRRMIDACPGRGGDFKSTCRQAKRICQALKLSETQTKEALTPFEVL